MKARRRREWIWPAVAALAAAAAVLAVVAAGAGGTSADPARRLQGRAPWPRNVAGLRARLGQLGLPALAREGTALHTHQHLDLFVDGRRVVVPANIGVDQSEGFISPLHTHDSSGVIHVESPRVRRYTLGQFFGVWGLRLTPRCLGGYCATGAKRLWVFVDGRRVSGDPRSVPLVDHAEILVAYGTRAQLPRPLPARYDFAPGL